MNKENIFYVYIHISKETDLPFYIGFGQKNRIKTKSRRSKEWNEIVDKEGYYYGFLKKEMSRVDANFFEKFCINIFNEIGFKLVNKINGGSGNSSRKPYSEEYKKVISERSKKFWREVSDEYKVDFGKKMSKILKGTKKTNRSEEHRRKQSLSHIGQVPWNKGRSDVYSENTINLIKKNNAFNKSILVYDGEGNLLYEFISISEASRNLNINRSKISKFLTGRYAKCEYIFRYKE